jgi:hypothetical protein
MDVTAHIDEIVVGNDGPDGLEAVTASLRQALGGVLDGEALSAVGRAVTEAVSGAVAEPSTPPGRPS